MSSKKPKYLRLEEKANIFSLLQKGASATAVAKQYGVTKSAISKIKNKKEAILKCVNNKFSDTGKRKTLRASNLPKMEECLYHWFIEQRQRNHPINSVALKEKAKEIHLQLKEKNTDFNASDGWLQGFKNRFGVRLAKITGEKLSAQPHFEDPFKFMIREKIEEMCLCHDQLYNANESSLFWKSLPKKSYVSSVEKTATGIKTEKHRITLLCCANATGTHKLKLLVIGEEKNLRDFKNFNCPTEYTSSKSSRMTAAIFRNWFYQSFVPQVTEFHSKNKLPVKALLLVNSAPSHLSELELKTQDGNIIAMFLPPNATPLTQNAIKITKLYYRNSLLDMITAKNSELVDAMKTVTLKDAVTFLEIAWNRVSTDTIAECWKNILSFTSDAEDPEDIILRILKEGMDSELQQLMARAVDVLNELNFQVEYTMASIQEWNEDILLNNDTVSFKIEELEVNDDDDDDDLVENVQRIQPSEAIEIFNRALYWAETENVAQNDLNVLRRLREKAAFQLLEKKKKQKKITDFFK